MRCQGLTLPELLFALTVLAILASLGAPALAELVQQTRARLEAGRLFSALLLARSEAIQHGLPVLFCPGLAGGTESGDCRGSYHDGWLLYADVDGNTRFDPQTDLALRAYAPLAARFALRNRAGTAAPGARPGYRPDGSAHSNLTLQLCPERPDNRDAWSVVLSPAGRPRLARGWGQCPL